MSGQKQLSFMLDASLYKQTLDYGGLSSILDHLSRSGVEEFRVKLLLNQTNILDKIADEFRNKFFVSKVLKRSENYISIQLVGEYGRKVKIRIDGKLLIFKHPIYKKVWILITDSSSEFIKKPVRYFLRTIHPRCAPIVLTTPQIEQLLKSFQKDGGNQTIRVKQIGQRMRISSVGAIKNIETDRRWTDLSVSEAFSEAREAGQWITDVLVNVGDENQSLIKIGRFGEFILKGKTKHLFDHFINLATQFGEERYNFLNNRQRSKETNFMSKPFHINFNSSVFSSKNQYQKLSTSLRKIPATSFTTLHSNPYFHASIVDYKDGSNYEIIVMNHNYLTVIPQGRATVRALQRLCSCIFSNFREGEIVEEITND